jgi:hypothetical protein
VSGGNDEDVTLDVDRIVNLDVARGTAQRGGAR